MVQLLLKHGAKDNEVDFNTSATLTDEDSDDQDIPSSNGGENDSVHSSID